MAKTFNETFKDYISKLIETINKEKEGAFSLYKNEYTENKNIIDAAMNQYSSEIDEQWEKMAESISTNVNNIFEKAKIIASCFYNMKQDYKQWCCTIAYPELSDEESYNERKTQLSMMGDDLIDSQEYKQKMESVQTDEENLIEILNTYAEKIFSQNLASYDSTNKMVYGYSVSEFGYSKLETIQEKAANLYAEFKELKKQAETAYEEMMEEVINGGEGCSQYFDDEGNIKLNEIINFGKEEEVNNYVKFDEYKIKIPFSDSENMFETEIDLDKKQIAKVVDVFNNNTDITKAIEFDSYDDLYPFNENSEVTFLQILRLSLMLYKKAYKEGVRINKNIEIFYNSIFNTENSKSLAYKFELISNEYNKLMYTNLAVDSSLEECIRTKWEYTIFPDIVKAFGHKINITENDVGTEKYISLSDYFLDVVITLSKGGYVRGIWNDIFGTKTTKKDLYVSCKLNDKIKKNNGCYVLDFSEIAKKLYLDGELITKTIVVLKALKESGLSDDRVNFADSLNAFSCDNIKSNITSENKWDGEYSIIYSDNKKKKTLCSTLSDFPEKDDKTTYGAYYTYLSQNGSDIKDSFIRLVESENEVNESAAAVAMSAATKVIDTVKDTVSSAAQSVKDTASSVVSKISGSISI